MTATRTIPAVLLVLIGQACADARPRPAGFTILDSAGVRIIDNAAPEWTEATAWTVDPEPVLSVGVASGEEPYLLSGVAGALRLDDGGLVIADGRSRELRFFDATGAWVRSVGGSGAGPGEFGSLRAVRRCGSDTLYAFDLGWRAGLFTTSGDWIGRLPQIITPAGGPPQDLSCGDGRFVAVGWDPEQLHRFIGYHRFHPPLQLVDASGSTVAELGTFPGLEYIGEEGGAGPHRFTRMLVHAIVGDRIYVGTGDGYEIRVLGLDGRLESLIRWTGPDLAFTDADLTRYRERRRAAATPESRQSVERDLRDWLRPETWPAYDALVLDPAGDLWIEDYDRPDPDPGKRWTVLDSEGRLLGRVALPEGLRLTEIGRDHVVGVRRDALDVERVEVFRLAKPAPPRGR